MTPGGYNARLAPVAVGAIAGVAVSEALLHLALPQIAYTGNASWVAWCAAVAAGSGSMLVLSGHLVRAASDGKWFFARILFGWGAAFAFAVLFLAFVPGELLWGVDPLVHLPSEKDARKVTLGFHWISGVRPVVTFRLTASIAASGTGLILGCRFGRNAVTALTGVLICSPISWLFARFLIEVTDVGFLVLAALGLLTVAAAVLTGVDRWLVPD